MAAPKTRPNKKSVRKFLFSVESEKRRKDAFELLSIFETVTNKKAVMWGDAIVGFGRYHYAQKSGRQADWPMTGFSPRKLNFSLYIMPGFDDYQHLLARLGKHKTSKCCLYVNRLDDIDKSVLQTLLSASLRDMERRYER